MEYNWKDFEKEAKEIDIKNVKSTKRIVGRSKTLETKLINKLDILKKERLQIQNLINNNNSMSYDYIFDKIKMIPFLNSQITLLEGLIND